VRSLPLRRQYRSVVKGGAIWGQQWGHWMTKRAGKGLDSSTWLAYSSPARGAIPLSFLWRPRTSGNIQARHVDFRRRYRVRIRKVIR
jgi:hypothetical protein